MKKINIAIDGYAGCGKSTLAKDLAQALNYTFVDTGAMYRAITLLCLKQGSVIDARCIQKVIDSEPDIRFQSATNHVLINGVDFESSIRSNEVANNVSSVAAFTLVREYLSKVQREILLNKGVVMEGRDIGTVILPDAELKLFITASLSVRTKRRLNQLKDLKKSVSIREVSESLERRDQLDAQREISPLAVAGDAIIIDNSEITRREQLRFCLSLARPIQNPEQFLKFIRE